MYVLIIYKNFDLRVVLEPRATRLRQQGIKAPVSNSQKAL